MDERNKDADAKAHTQWEAEGDHDGRSRLNWGDAKDAGKPADAAEAEAEDSIDVVESAKERIKNKPD